MSETNNEIPKDLKAKLTALTRDLVLIPSTDSRPTERQRCFQFFRNHLESLEGIAIAEHTKNGYVSLLALPVGIEHPEILLCGHLDVIEHPDGDSYRSVIHEGRIYGPGAGDMKGQLAIMLELFRNLHRQHPGISLGLAITSDEERGGECGVRFLVEDLGLRCGLAIIPDGGSLNDITVEEKGILHLCVRSHGHSSHAARPWLADNPLLRLTEGLVRLREHFDGLKPPDLATGDHWYPTCTNTIIRTPNDTINRIPSEAEAALDVRFPPPHTIDGMLGTIRGVLGDELQVDCIVGAEATQLDPDPEFLEWTERITGQSARLVKASGGSDARFLCAHDIPVLLSRPLVGNLHAEDEWIDIQSMETYFRICHAFIESKHHQSSPI